MLGAHCPHTPALFSIHGMGPFGEWYQLQTSLALYFTAPLPSLRQKFQ